MARFKPKSGFAAAGRQTYFATKFAGSARSSQRLEPTAHNGLVGGSSPPGPTTQSFEPEDFPETSQRPAIGGL
jgi:hypothetical protein